MDTATAPSSKGQRVCMRWATPGLAPAAAQALYHSATASTSRLPRSRRSTTTRRWGRRSLQASGQPTWAWVNTWGAAPGSFKGCSSSEGPLAPACSTTITGRGLLLSPSNQRAGSMGAAASGPALSAMRQPIRSRPAASASASPRPPSCWRTSTPATWSAPPLMCRVTDSSFMRYSLTRAKGR